MLALAIAALPLPASAQTTNKPAATKKTAQKQSDSTAKSKSGHPFHGKLAAVDQTAKTIKLGESTYQITSQTKIMKAGKPATLEDAWWAMKSVGLCQTHRRRKDGRDVRAVRSQARRQSDGEGQKTTPKSELGGLRLPPQAFRLSPPPTGLALGCLCPCSTCVVCAMSNWLRALDQGQQELVVAQVAVGRVLRQHLHQHVAGGLGDLRDHQVRRRQRRVHMRRHQLFHRGRLEGHVPGQRVIQGAAQAVHVREEASPAPA